MQIESSFSIAEAERIIRTVEGQATDTVVTLPSNSRAHQLGGEPAVVQALVTWARTQTNATVDTYLPGMGGRQIGELPRRLVGLCAALLLDRARDIHGRDVTDELRQAALDRLDRLQIQRPGRWSRGQQLELLCADHLGRSAPESLYSRTGAGLRLRSRIEFDGVADMILSETNAERRSVKAAGGASERAFRDGIADAVYELFRNTEEYARTDATGGRQARSLRGIHARRHSVTKEVLGKAAAGSTPLAGFYERRVPPRDRREIPLLEVSIFDSGPGYASHWLKRPLADIKRDEEHEAIRTCFAKHATRKGTRDSGLGLCTVVDILRRGDGFMRLRTGRQSLYADLGLEKGRRYGELPDLRSWQDMRLAEAAGTLFTFILPL